MPSLLTNPVSPDPHGKWPIEPIEQRRTVVYTCTCVVVTGRERNILMYLPVTNDSRMFRIDSVAPVNVLMSTNKLAGGIKV